MRAGGGHSAVADSLRFHADSGKRAPCARHGSQPSQHVGCACAGCGWLGCCRNPHVAPCDGGPTQLLPVTSPAHHWLRLHIWSLHLTAGLKHWFPATGSVPGCGDRPCWELPNWHGCAGCPGALGTCILVFLPGRAGAGLHTSSQLSQLCQGRGTALPYLRPWLPCSRL